MLKRVALLSNVNVAIIAYLLRDDGSKVWEADGCGGI